MLEALRPRSRRSGPTQSSASASRSARRRSHVPDGGTRTRSTHSPSVPMKPFARSPSSLTVFGPSREGVSKLVAVRSELPLRWQRAERAAPIPGATAGCPPRTASTRAARRCGSSSASASPGSPCDPPGPGSGRRARTARGASTGPRSPTARTASAGPRPARPPVDRQVGALEEQLAREQGPVQLALRERPGRRLALESCRHRVMVPHARPSVGGRVAP